MGQAIMPLVRNSCFCQQYPISLTHIFSMSSQDKGGSKDSVGGGDGSCYKCGQKGHWSNGMISIHWLNNLTYLMNFPRKQPVQMVQQIMEEEKGVLVNAVDLCQ